jgi:molybdopterin-binding protein
MRRRIIYSTIAGAGKKDAVMKLSARNVLKGKVKNIVEGLVNDEVVVELPGGQEVVAVITKTSAKSLGLREGKDVFAVIKASSVMLAVD